MAPKKKTFHTRVRERYEVIETGGMAPRNAPPPPKPVSKPPTLPFKKGKA